MPYTVRQSIYLFLQQIKVILEQNLSKVIIYGSYARGDYHANSDVDIMILVDLSNEEIKGIENKIFDIAFDIEMNTGVDISPILKNRMEYEYWMDVLPFYKNIKEEGIIINE